MNNRTSSSQTRVFSQLIEGSGARILVYVLFFLLAFAVEQRLSGQSSIPDKEANNIRSILDGIDDEPIDQRIKSLNQAAIIVAAYSAGNPSLQAAKLSLEIERSSLELSSPSFGKLITAMSSNDSPDSRGSTLRQIRNVALGSATTAIELVVQDGIAPDEVEQVLIYAKDVSRIYDDFSDIRDPAEKGALTGSSSNLTKAIKLISGIIIPTKVYLLATAECLLRD